MEYRENLFIEDDKMSEKYRFELVNIIKSDFREEGFRIHSRTTALVWVVSQGGTLPLFVKELEQKVLEDILKIPLVSKSQSDYKLNHVRKDSLRLSLQIDTLFVKKLIDSLSVYDNICVLYFDNKIGSLGYQIIDNEILSNTFDRYFKDLQAELEENVKQYKVQKVMDEFKTLTVSEQTEFLKTIITSMRGANAN